MPWGWGKSPLGPRIPQWKPESNRMVNSLPKPVAQKPQQRFKGWGRLCPLQVVLWRLKLPLALENQRFRKHSPGWRVGGPDIWGHRVRAGFQIPNIYAHTCFRKESGQSNICSLAWSSRSSEHHAPRTRSPVHTQISEWWPGDGDLWARFCEEGDIPAGQCWTSCLHPQHPALGVDSPTEQLDQTQPSHTFCSFQNFFVLVVKMPTKVWTKHQFERLGLHSLSASLSDLQREEQKMTSGRQFQAEYRKPAPGLPERFAEELSSYQTAHPWREDFWPQNELE